MISSPSTTSVARTGTLYGFIICNLLFSCMDMLREMENYLVYHLQSGWAPRMSDSTSLCSCSHFSPHEAVIIQNSACNICSTYLFSLNLLIGYPVKLNFGSLMLNCNICRYKKLLSCVDLTKDFFYSYTYPIMQSLQKNVTSADEERMPYENIFVWNAFLTEPIRSRCNNTIWTLALVHGNFKQVLTSQFVPLVYVFLCIYTAYYDLPLNHLLYIICLCQIDI